MVMITFPLKSEISPKISHPNTILMMMMTIWWSKATRLLEFSRSYLGSLYQRYAVEKCLECLGNDGPRQPGFFVTDTFCVTEELGILVSGYVFS